MTLHLSGDTSVFPRQPPAFIFQRSDVSIAPPQNLMHVLISGTTSVSRGPQEETFNAALQMSLHKPLPSNKPRAPLWMK